MPLGSHPRFGNSSDRLATPRLAFCRLELRANELARGHPLVLEGYLRAALA